MDVDDVQGLVDHDLAPGLQTLELDVGADADPHLAAGGVDVGGLVLGLGHEDAEAGRRLGEPVDLGLQGRRSGRGPRATSRRGVRCWLRSYARRSGRRPAAAPAWRCRAGGRPCAPASRSSSFDAAVPASTHGRRDGRSMVIEHLLDAKPYPRSASRTGVILAIRAGGRPTLAGPGPRRRGPAVGRRSGSRCGRPSRAGGVRPVPRRASRGPATRVASGSVNPLWTRSVSTVRASWVVVAT